MRISFLLVSLLGSLNIMTAQQKFQNPVITNYGGIYNIGEATVLPDASLNYKIVIDLLSGNDPAKLNTALNNVARMINLHAIGGVRPDSIRVVLAIHGSATKTILTNDAYRERYRVNNPNLELINELSDAGVKLTVCGQSLIGSKIDPSEVNNKVEIATSMLTTVTTYQCYGYTLLKF